MKVKFLAFSDLHINSWNVSYEYTGDRLADSNNLMHRAFHAYKGLTNNVKPSSIVYGMGTLVNHMIKQFRPDKVYMCWDKERSPHRLKLHPEYKQGRKTKTEEERKSMKEQMKSSMKLFNALGIHQLYGKGMEADDWVYILSRKHQDDYVTIVSSDKDFNQLLGKRLKIWNPNKNLLIGKHNVKAHFGYSEKECLDYLILDGDSSDNIPGYRGMGEQNIKIFLSQHGSIRKFIEDESLETCKRYCRNGDVIAERIPYHYGYSIRITWYKPYKLFQFTRWNKNIFWLHWSIQKQFTHKTGKVVFTS